MADGDRWYEAVRLTVRRPDPNRERDHPIVHDALIELNAEMDRASPVSVGPLPRTPYPALRPTHMTTCENI